MKRRLSNELFTSSRNNFHLKGTKLIKMINSAFLCVFAACAIFLVNPSTGGPLGVERAAVNNGRQPAVNIPALIDADHPQHPNQICQRDANPNSVVTWLMMVEMENITDPDVSCSESIVCFSRDEKDELLVLAEKPMEGVECRPYYESDSYRYMCIQGECVRVDGLFPNAPTDQDEAESDYLIANDYSEIQFGYEKAKQN